MLSNSLVGARDRAMSAGTLRNLLLLRSYVLVVGSRGYLLTFFGREVGEDSLEQSVVVITT